MMRALRTLKPGTSGAKNETEKYGNKLICVRYRMDPVTLKKYKTVELIEDEIQNSKKEPGKIPVNKILHLKIYINEYQLRKVVKASGGKWDVKSQTWLLAYREILNLGLENRIVFGNNS
ncbi:hypothetical protein JW948_08390 [bacterium]|nr:hypothetical protein [bacterium]